MPMKYVIAQSGTHQLRVEEDDLVEVDQLTSEIGDRIELPVMLLSDSGKVKVGSPLVEGVKVSATVVEHFRGPKIRVFKYRAKQRYRRRRGHRQALTRLRIDNIVGAASTGRMLSELDVGKRLVSTLDKAGIKTTDDVLERLEDRGDAALLELAGFGKKGLQDLKESLRDEGFVLPDEE